MNIQFLSFPEIFDEIPYLKLERRLEVMPPVEVIQAVKAIPAAEYPPQRLAARRAEFIRRIDNINSRALHEQRPTDRSD